MLFRIFLALEMILLLSSVAIWSSQVIVDAIPSGKAAGSFKGDSFLEESLPVITLGAVSIIGSEFTLSFLLSPEENKDKASREEFLEVDEAETLLEEHLAIRQVWGLFLE